MLTLTTATNKIYEIEKFSRSFNIEADGTKTTSASIEINSTKHPLDDVISELNNMDFSSFVISSNETVILTLENYILSNCYEEINSYYYNGRYTISLDKTIDSDADN